MKSAPRRAVVGFLVGLAVWLVLAPVYNPIVTLAAKWVIHAAEHPNVTSLEVAGRDAIIHRTDFDARSPRPRIPISDLTFNFVILTALFGFSGLERKGNRDTRLIIALLLLFSVHTVAVVVRVMSLFVTQMGPWSTAHYSPMERNLWATLYHFYRFVGAYALVFGIWWWLGPEAPQPASRPSKRAPNR